MTNYDEKAIEAAAKAVCENMEGGCGICGLVKDSSSCIAYTKRRRKIAEAVLTACHAHESVQREEAGTVKGREWLYKEIWGKADDALDQSKPPKKKLIKALIEIKRLCLGPIPDGAIQAAQGGKGGGG